MRIFMTGGTGMIGRRLIAILESRGDEVTVLSRSANEVRRLPEFRRIRVIPGDPSEPGPWQDEISGVDAVVNLAGQNVFSARWTPAIRTQIRDSRVYSTDHLVAAIRQAQNRPAVFVQGSAVGYYGHTGDEELTEAAGSGTDFLAVVCRELEDAAQPVEGLGVRLVAVRTGVVLGRGAGALRVMVPIFKWGGAAPVGSGGSWLRPARGMQWLSWIHLDDIVGLFVLALDHSDARGPINGTAPEPARNAQFSRALARTLHRPILPIGPPDLILHCLLGGVADTITTGQRVIPLRARELGYQFLYPELTEAIRAALQIPGEASRLSSGSVATRPS